MRDWYFENGDGLYLTAASRKLFFQVVETLEGENIHPESARRRMTTMSETDRDGHLGCICRRQLSLLRTQLKNDLAVYADESTYSFLRSDEKNCLRSAISVNRVEDCR